MPKINAWFLPRIELKSEAKTFGDPADPNGHFTITLRPLSIPEASMAGEHAREFEELYGGVDPKTEEPRFLLSPLGERIHMDWQFISSMAMIVDMQDEAPEEDRYTFEELVGLSLRLPVAFQEMLTWSGIKQGEAGLGKRSPAGAAPSSVPPSPPDNLILNGCPTSPPLSGVSTSECPAERE